MKLYRIRRKDNGKFFEGWSPYHEDPKWNQSGTFFKRIDTVANHLKLLSSDWQRKIDCLGFGDQLKKGNYTVKKTYRTRLNRYEVVINDVAINGEQVIAAREIVK